MSKLLSNILENISENNNEYRRELDNLNKLINEKTSSLVGDIVTNSNYTIDFSNTLIGSRENLSSPIEKAVESYVIRDLRVVESVNEQFIEKINNKIADANIKTEEDKSAFIDSLSSLLNDKYLEIVSIKRVDFISEDGKNNEVEQIVSSFLNSLNLSVNVSEITNCIEIYKNELYSMISDSLIKISDLYLNNFTNEVMLALKNIDDFSKEEVAVVSAPVMPEFPSIPEMPAIEVPEMPSMPEINVSSETEVKQEEALPQIPEFPSIPEMPAMEVPEMPAIEVPEMPSMPTIEEFQSPFTPVMPAMPEIPVVENTQEEYAPMEVPVVEPTIINEPLENRPTNNYDVEEILKRAKSPIVAEEETKEEESKYLSLKPIEHVNEPEIQDFDFNEKEIVEEMIRRLTKRLEKIKEEEARLADEEQKITEDEGFVNDLIESSNSKKEELDVFEKELNEKEEMLNGKQKELDDRLNEVLPLANVIMKNEETNE